MCEKCNEALIAAATAAKLLAEAANTLYNINEQASSKILADAAAELFTPTKTSDVNNFKDAAETPKGNPGKEEPPRPFHIDDNGVVYINGAALGRIVVLGGRKPTQH